MWEILIGAGITIATLVITSLIQWKRDQKTREWQVSDQQNELAKQILTHRIEQLESYAKELTLLTGSAAIEIAEILHMNVPHKKIDYLTQVNTQMAALNSQVIYYVAISRYLGEEVDKIFLELILKQRTIWSLCSEALRKLEANETIEIIDDDEDEGVAAGPGAATVFAELLKALDVLRFNNPAHLLQANQTDKVISPPGA